MVCPYINALETDRERDGRLPDLSLLRSHNSFSPSSLYSTWKYLLIFPSLSMCRWHMCVLTIQRCSLRDRSFRWPARNDRYENQRGNNSRTRAMLPIVALFQIEHPCFARFMSVIRNWVQRYLRPRLRRSNCAVRLSHINTICSFCHQIENQHPNTVYLWLDHRHF